MEIVDSNVIIAAMFDQDDNHVQAAALLDEREPPFLVSIGSIAEIAHLLDERVGHEAELKFLDALAEGEIVPVMQLQPGFWIAVRDLARQYADNKFGGIDASVCISAISVGADTILTFDKHFRAIVLPTGEYFNVLPY